MLDFLPLSADDSRMNHADTCYSLVAMAEKIASDIDDFATEVGRAFFAGSVVAGNYRSTMTAARLANEAIREALTGVRPYLNGHMADAEITDADREVAADPRA